MKDDRKDHGKRDRSRVDEDEPWEARWLAQELGVNVEELSDAVEDAGLIVSPTTQNLGRN
jgi:hypothetical protein